ncbi:MAG: GIY-YIG nuclease family protein [Proteobacteria bacterium]|nr:GIY-YIG nuclease family protein [Pseudomonadota bacterium]
MPKETTIKLTGRIGGDYDFDVYAWNTSFQSLGAVYVVLRKRYATNFSVLYIGQTGDLSRRFDDHHQQSCFDRNGKTHIGIHPKPTETKRFEIESDLLGNYTTMCND